MTQGASPHGVPFSTMVPSQQSTEVSPRSADDIQQPSPPHCRQPGAQHAAPLEDSRPGMPLLHIGVSGGEGVKTRALVRRQERTGHATRRKTPSSLQTAGGRLDRHPWCGTHAGNI